MKSLRARFRRTVDVSLAQRLGSWPLPSFIDAAFEDQLADEIAHFARLAPIEAEPER